MMGAKQGVAVLRNGTNHASLKLKDSVEVAGGRLKEVKEKLATNPVHPGHLGTAMMERMHVAGRHYEIGGRTVEQERQLNEGGFAFVYLARDIHTDEELVLKKILCQDKASILMARREVEILERLPPHPNLVKYYGHHLDKADNGSKEVVLLFELCPGGHLLDLLELNQCRLTEAKILSVFRDVCTAVCLLHAKSPPVQHRDLKVENILLGANGSFKLCDFGSWSDECSSPGNMDRQAISKLQENIEKYTTMMYRPPEMVDFYQQYEVTEKCDIWMLGCILFTLMFCRHPFQDESTLAISNARYDFPQEPAYSSKLQDLTHWLLARDPRLRPSAAEVYDILANFDDDTSLSLPKAVIDQKNRQRNLYECTGPDLDAPIRFSKDDSAKKERRSKDGSSSKPKRRSGSTKAHKSHSSKGANLATWGDVAGDGWPSMSVPPPSGQWAAFPADQPCGHADSAGSTALPFQQDVAAESERQPSGHSGRSTSSRARKSAPPATWGEGPATGQDAWMSPSASPAGQPGSNWDPFGTAPQNSQQGYVKAGFSHERHRSFQASSGGPSLLRTPDPHAGRRSHSVEGRADAAPRQAAPLWPFAGNGSGDVAASASPVVAAHKLHHAKTVPLPSADDVPQWPLSANGNGEVAAPPPVSNGSPWSFDRGPSSPREPRSPWDTPNIGPAPAPVAINRLVEAPPLVSQDPWAPRDDPFDWLRGGGGSGPTASTPLVPK